VSQIDETAMIESRRSEQRTKERQPMSYHRETSAKGGAVRVTAGRSAYREEFQRNYGPDLDEALDSVESGHEF